MGEFRGPDTLIPKGSLYLEVPASFEEPMGMPLNPTHEKEYNLSELGSLVKKSGFPIQAIWGKDRYAFFKINYDKFEEKKVLDRRVTAILIHALKI
jgi:hypothetical protein